MEQLLSLWCLVWNELVHSGKGTSKEFLENDNIEAVNIGLIQVVFITIKLLIFIIY